MGFQEDTEHAALDKVKQLFSKEHFFGLQKQIASPLLQSHHHLRQVRMPRISSHFDWLTLCSSKLAKDSDKRKSHSSTSKNKVQFQNVKSVALEEGPKQNVRAFRLYAINMLNQHVEALQRQSSPTQQDHEFTQCELKEYILAFKKIKSHASKSQAGHRMFKNHKIKNLAEKKEEKDMSKSELWEELMKNKEERQFQIGRITKYFTS
jgi:hypothetical protein